MARGKIALLLLLGLLVGTHAGSSSSSPPGCTIDDNDSRTTCSSDGQCCDKPNSDRCCLVFTGSGQNNGNDHTCGPVASTNGNYVCAGDGGSSGDPILAGFDGSTFEFQGLPYAYFSLITERDHQLNAFFTPAVMHDHNGTYITALGFSFGKQQIAVRVLEDGMLNVELNGKPLQLIDEENELSLTLTDPATGTSMRVTWELYHAGLGQTVTIHTPLMVVSVWATAPGTVDAGGVVQPAYLNTRFKLLQAPAGNRMDGVLGRTYSSLVQNLMAGTAPPAEQFLLPVKEVAHCRVAGLFDTPAKLQLATRRMLLESANAVVSFPVTAQLAGHP